MSPAPASGSKTLPSHSRKPTAPAASLGGTMPNPTRDSCRSAPPDPHRQSLPPQGAPKVVAAATHPRRAAAETPSADPLGESCSSPLRPWCTNHSTLPHYALTSAKSDRLLASACGRILRPWVWRQPGVIRWRILHGRSNYPDLLSSGLSGATGPLGECRVLWFGSRRGAGG